MTSQLPCFRVSFSQLPAAKKHTQNGAAVTSLRSFLFRDDFTSTTLFEVFAHPNYGSFRRPC